MHQAEALWLSFDAAPWKPSAVTVGVGRINALSGGTWPGTLDAAPQNYLVCPPQLWLDGINAGHGFVRQFVAMPLGQRRHRRGPDHGVEIARRPAGPRVRSSPGPLPRRAAAGVGAIRRRPPPSMASASGAPMGFVPGGQIDQKVLADRMASTPGIPSASARSSCTCSTARSTPRSPGRPAPPSPVSARDLRRARLPWFRRFEEAADVPPADALAAQLDLAGRSCSSTKGTTPST